MTLKIPARSWLLMWCVTLCLIVTSRASAQSQSADRFSGAIDGQAFSSTSAQSVGIARGNVTFLMPQQNLLLYKVLLIGEADNHRTLIYRHYTSRPGLADGSDVIPPHRRGSFATCAR